MRHLTIRIIVAILTFIIGITFTMIWLTYRSPISDKLANERVPAKTPVAFCDLVENPDHYNSDIVRVRATLRGYHELALYDLSCNNKEKYIRADFDAELRQKLIKAVEALNGSGFQQGNFWVNVVLVGRFEEVESENRSLNVEESNITDRQHIKYHFSLTVLDVEHAEAVKLDSSSNPQKPAIRER